MKQDQYMVTGFLDGDILLFDLVNNCGFKKYKIPSEIEDSSVRVI